MVSKIKCLAIDEKEANRAQLKNILDSASGIKSFTCSPLKALDQLIQTQADIVLLNLQQAIENSFELYRKAKIRCAGRKVSFIFYSNQTFFAEASSVNCTFANNNIVVQAVEAQQLTELIQSLSDNESTETVIANASLSSNRSHCLSLPQSFSDEIEYKRNIPASHFQNFINTLPCDAFFYRINEKGFFSYVSPSIINVLGYESHDFLNHFTTFMSDDAENQIALEAMELTLKGVQMESFEITLFDKYRSSHHLKLSQTPVLNKNQHWEIDGLAYDITSLHQMRKQLNHQAHYDTLTGLPNRLLAIDRLKFALAYAERNKQYVGVIVLDLDNFNKINAAAGQDVGDRVLQEVAQRLKQCVRESDTIARLGGDEFLLILSCAFLESYLNAIANKINDSFSDPFIINEKAFHLNASLGITLFPIDDKEADNLIRNAGLAMQTAKKDPRNHFFYFTESLNQQAQHKVELENQLRQALHKNELEIFYHPVIDLSCNRVIAVEALLRWQNTDLGRISPDIFIPIAESTGEILAIFNWLLENVCQNYLALKQQFKHLQRIAVNISSHQFRQNQFTEIISRQLEKYQIPADSLCLEIEENSLLEDIPQIQHHLKKIQAANMPIALDNFGAGYSSINHLKQFPFSILKIDRAFIQDIGHDADNEAIVKSIIAMAQALNIEVIAEGVETETQHRFLQENNCQMAQGFYYGRPKSLEL